MSDQQLYLFIDNRCHKIPDKGCIHWGAKRSDSVVKPYTLNEIKKLEKQGYCIQGPKHTSYPSEDNRPTEATYDELAKLYPEQIKTFLKHKPTSLCVTACPASVTVFEDEDVVLKYLCSILNKAIVIFTRDRNNHIPNKLYKAPTEVIEGMKAGGSYECTPGIIQRLKEKPNLLLKDFDQGYQLVITYLDKSVLSSVIITPKELKRQTIYVWTELEKL